MSAAPYHIGMDTNGNKTVLVRPGRFSIQTNGNLPRTHKDGVGPWTDAEVRAYVRAYGTKHQKLVINNL